MQGTNPTQQPDNSTTMMLFAVISSVFVIIIVVVFVVAILAGNVANRQPTAANLYNVTTRPLPTVNKLSDLLPATLGRFKRGALSGSFQNFSATYQSGTDSVKISGSQGISVQAALASVAQVATAAGHTGNESLNVDPSYYLSTAPGNGPARFAWSHYVWFFDAQAGTKTALDDFMTAFPY